MQTYTVTAEKLHKGKWKTITIDIVGYAAALRVAKALHAAAQGAALLRNATTGHARFVEAR